MPEIAIQTKRLTRTFGNLTAVEAIDLQLLPASSLVFSGRMAQENPRPSRC